MIRLGKFLQSRILRRNLHLEAVVLAITQVDWSPCRANQDADRLSLQVWKMAELHQDWDQTCSDIQAISAYSVEGTKDRLWKYLS